MDVSSSRISTTDVNNVERPELNERSVTYCIFVRLTDSEETSASSDQLRATAFFLDEGEALEEEEEEEDVVIFVVVLVVVLVVDGSDSNDP